MRLAYYVFLRLLPLLCVGLTSCDASGDYVSFRNVGSYKLHTESETYAEAVQVCEGEGAHLAIINSKAEEDVVINLLLATDIPNAWVGVNDIAMEGFMVTALGEPWSSVGFSKWSLGEPNDSGRGEDCVCILKNRLMNDQGCNDQLRFFCEKKKTGGSSHQGAVVSFSDGYVTVPNVGSYKLHRDKAPYSEAGRVCESEGAHLAVIKSKDQEDVVANLLQGRADLYYAFIGVNDVASEGNMVTVLGDSWADVGFSKWDKGEPNNAAQVEDCVLITNKRMINDVPCGQQQYFVCQKYGGTSSALGYAGGYTTVPGLGSYILHNYIMSYNLAAAVCDEEGSYLAVINSAAEENLLMDMLAGTEMSKAYVGINDIAVEGNMTTVLGESWVSVGFTQWAPGEPKDADGTNDCVVIGKDRLMKGRHCGDILGYFCEKKTATSSSGQTHLPSMASYITVPDLGRYALHEEMKTYGEALQICEDEGAHLAIINSKDEGDALINIMEEKQQTKAYIGVNDIGTEGRFVTLFDEVLRTIRPYVWANGEPKNRNGLEDCVIVRRDKKMKVQTCGERTSFLCEKANGCRALAPDASVVMECSVHDVVVNCAENAQPGTIAVMTCAQGFEHESEKKFFTTVCQPNNVWSAPPIKCGQDCGRANLFSARAYVANGNVVTAGELPWHVSIYFQENRTYKQHCGGTLITPTHIISAAHCFWNNTEGTVVNKTKFKVTAGQIGSTWDESEEGTQKRSVAELLMPVQFRGRSSKFQSDIAILRLSKSFAITDTVNLACTDWNSVDGLVEGDNGTVAGWGLDETNVKSSTLKSVQLAYIPYNTCWNTFSKNPGFQQYLTVDKMCAGWTNTGTSVCPGDSGGGLVFPKTTNKGTRYYLRGIVSVGPQGSGGCNTDSAAAFTDITKHEEFLARNIQNP